MTRDLIDWEDENPSDPNPALINIYKGAGVSDSVAQRVFDEFHYQFDDLVTNGYISSHYIRYFDCDFDRSDYPNKNAINALETWLTDNGYDDKGHNTGLHIGEHNNPGAASGDDAWVEFAHAQVYADQGTEMDVVNTAIHEALHQFIDSSLGNVDPLLGDDPDHDGEHTLGKVYYHSTSSTYIETPLGSPGASPYGSCDGMDTKPGYYTSDPTNCSKDSVGYTHDDRF